MEGELRLQEDISELKIAPELQRGVTYFKKKFMVSFLVAIAVTSLLGSVIEMSEYWGFRFIGFGEGYLGFECEFDTSVTLEDDQYRRQNN